MIKIFTNREFTRVGFYESVLKEAGIRCFIQNAGTQYYLGSISHLFYPTLFIIDDDNYEDAIELLKPLHEQALPLTSGSEEWKCPKCSEIVPAEFGSCWQCGEMKKTTSEP